MANKFPIRKTIMVKGVKYKIIEKAGIIDEDGNSCHGLHDPGKRIIYIDPTMDDSLRVHTFLHELFHAYMYQSHMTSAVDYTLEEVIVDLLSHAINENFTIKWKRKRRS